MSRDKKTYGSIAEKYDRWVDYERTRAPRAHLRRVDPTTPVIPGRSTDMSRTIQAAIGFGIAALILFLAAYAFSTAGYWADHGRDGAQVGYILVGVFLCIAGIGGAIAVWNHNFRVLVRPPSNHHH